LSSIVNWNTEENVRLVWSDFKDLFKQEYAVQNNDKLILEGLSNLAMKPNETTNKLLTRITRTTRVIRESFDDYVPKSNTRSMTKTMDFPTTHFGRS
jgi:hypothetical protein